MRERSSQAVCALCLLAAALLAFDVAGEEQQVPAGSKAETDPWAYYVMGGRWQEGRTFYNQAIIAACEKVRSAPERDLMRLHYGLLVCTYLPAIERTSLKTADQLSLARWLLANGDFAYELLATIRPSDDPARVLEIVNVIREISASRALEYAPMTIAFAVVWDGYAPQNQPLRDAFDFYADNAGSMRVDLRRTPVAMLKYVVDSQRPRAEKEWALKRFGSVTDMRRVYEMPPYDLDAFLLGRKGALAGHDPTLENMLRYGGVCHDRAVFASEVGKAIGIPCVYIAGRSVSGIGHAWVGYLRRRGRGYVWDLDSGRIGEEGETIGLVIEPQEGVARSEYELDLALRAMDASEDTRRRARLWWQVADLLADAGLAQSADALERSLAAGILDRAQWALAARLASRGLLGTERVEALA